MGQKNSKKIIKINSGSLTLDKKLKLLPVSLQSIQLLRKFATSMGAMATMLQFLDEKEGLRLQALSKWFYEIAIGRA